ncbi:phosphotransferase [Candidatus Sumerlaeota bacterium]|nr:phosphotransferase [Candidatus Sumerlaeota bacterium]
MNEIRDKESDASQAGPFPGIGDTALRSYDVAPVQIDFITHSENATFRVEAEGGGVYALRVHYPVSEHFPAEWRRRETIESEVEWLAAMRRDADLPVPEPVRNKDDSWVTQVVGEHLPETLNCTLLNWIDGEILDGRPTLRQARKIGELIAGVHEHGALWERPRGFVRPEHDPQAIEDDMARLRGAVGEGSIGDPDFLVLEKAAERLYETTRELGKKSNVWGLIHADATGANIVVGPKGVALIDFSSCALGHYAFDLATPILHLAGRDPARSGALLEGYRSVRELPPEPEITIPASVVGRMIDTLAFVLTRPERHEKMKRGLLPWTVQYCEDFLNGRIALFEP